MFAQVRCFPTLALGLDAHVLPYSAAESRANLGKSLQEPSNVMLAAVVVSAEELAPMGQRNGINALTQNGLHQWRVDLRGDKVGSHEQLQGRCRVAAVALVGKSSVRCC